jgi:hypothetical protein
MAAAVAEAAGATLQRAAGEAARLRATVLAVLQRAAGEAERLPAAVASVACAAAGFGVKEPGINPAGGAIPRRSGPLDHRAGERGFRSC